MVHRSDINTQPFLALTKTASSPSAAVKLITSATSAPNTFVFAELLAAPQIQSLSTSEEHSPYLTLLKIFSYGTYSDYKSTASLPELTAAQALKLRQLSLLTIAQDPADLTYDNLMGKLGLGSNVRELEDLVISAIYADLIEATLDSYNKRVLISSISPLRDLPPDSIPVMLSTLQQWSERCTTTLSELEAQIAEIKTQAARRAKEDREWSAHVEKLMEVKEESSKESNAKTSGGGGGVGGMFSGLGKRLGGGGGKRENEVEEGDMDIDEDEEDEGARKSTRSSKKRGFGLGK